MAYKFKLLMLCFFVSIINTYAQTAESDSSKVKFSDSAGSDKKPPKPKEIKKLDDPLLALAPDLIGRLKQMKPNQLLVVSERFVRNERRVDDDGSEYEVTVTVRLGFSQDMITGIVKEVPLYQSAQREMNIVQVKIPVKFCCTTPIDSVHKKEHCGKKMSELNDMEDNEHCKDWRQQDEEKEEADAAASFGKSSSGKGAKKKGATTTGKAGETSEGGFGKPAPKGKTSKKGKKGAVTDDDEITDSTGKTTKRELPVKVVPKVKSSKNGKAAIDKTTSTIDSTAVAADSSAATTTKEPVKSTDKKGKKKNEKVETEKKVEPVKEEGFGKPQSKGKKKGKTLAEETPPIGDSTTVVTDSIGATKQEPVKTNDKKTKKKKG